MEKGKIIINLVEPPQTKTRFQCHIDDVEGNEVQPKEGMIVVIEKNRLMLDSMFSGQGKKEHTTRYRSGKILQLTEQGTNTPHSWCVREHETIHYYSVDLCFMRVATDEEIARYDALKMVVA